MTSAWEAHRTHLLSAPSAEGLASLALEISPGSRPVRSRRLGGGLGASTHAIDIRTRTGRTLKLVLKRFEPGEDASVLEWDRLTFATRIPVPSPEPVALDEDGTWFGALAFAMTRLPGSPNVSPVMTKPWLEQISGALIRIHETPRGRPPACIRRPRTFETWEPPAGMKKTPLVSRAIDAVREALPGAMNSALVIGHGDFHPGNLLWSRGQLAGVIDWAASQISPRSFEVAYRRADLTVLVGIGSADLFLRMYENALGKALDDLWMWDLICGLSAMRWGHRWVVAYREQGRDDLTARNVWPRVSVLLRNALAQS